MYCYDNEYHFEDLADLISSLDWDEEYIKAQPDDYVINVRVCELEPIVTLSADWICKKIHDDRWGEDGAGYDETYAAIEKHIDFEKANAAIPKFYYQTKQTVTFSKAEILDAF